MITNTPMTVYNKYVENRAEKYQRTALSAVLWDSSSATVKHKSANMQDNKAVIALPHYIGGAYLKPKVWLALVDKTANWTLQEGDVVVRGIVVDEITEGFTLSALRAKYDDVLEIVSVAFMDQGSPNTHHWEVLCK
ncbi:MAG: hypothetical protein HY865_22170 [Chloroflexi bacterium]|nr:hypothetical protein [Chloroflexota bacterium]